MKRMAVVALAVVFAFGLFCGFAGEAQAKEYKIGYVDLMKISDEYTKTKEYETNFESQVKVKDTERQKFVDEIRKLKDEQALLSDKSKAEKQTVVDDKIKNLQEFDRKTRDDLLKQRNTMLGDIQKDIDSVISAYAKEAGYDLVLIKQTVLYGGNELEITAEVVKRLNTKK